MRICVLKLLYFTVRICILYSIYCSAVHYYWIVVGNDALNVLFLRFLVLNSMISERFSATIIFPSLSLRYTLSLLYACNMNIRKRMLCPVRVRVAKKTNIVLYCTIWQFAFLSNSLRSLLILKLIFSPNRRFLGVNI